jgi:hypothetical protein
VDERSRCRGPGSKEHLAESAKASGRKHLEQMDNRPPEESQECQDFKDMQPTGDDAGFQGGETVFGHFFPN